MRFFPLLLQNTLAAAAVCMILEFHAVVVAEGEFAAGTWQERRLVSSGGWPRLAQTRAQGRFGDGSLDLPRPGRGTRSGAKGRQNRS